jgi:oxygen-independent coproporphyrinogen-3 oxidase
MLEVDDDSRLGRELIAGGQRYHAHHVPDDDQTADFYVSAIERLNSAGICQYEISNFARPGFESRHNLKYWNREPYIGFGVDAHSMLPSTSAEFDAVRFATPDSIEAFTNPSPLPIANTAPEATFIKSRDAAEERLFLGLRRNRGVLIHEIASEFNDAVRELISEGLLQQTEGRVMLTDRGRLLSNEVFARFLPEPV